MQRFALFLLAVLLAGAATMLGVVSAFERTAANPEYYSNAINQIGLTGFAVPLAEKLTGQNGKVAQVLQLGMNRLEPQLKQQTAAHLQQFFQYLRGKTEKFDLVYDMTTLQSDTAFTGEVVETLQKDSKLGLLPRSLLQPVAQKLTNQLPGKIDLLSLAGRDEGSMASLRKDAQAWLSTADRWLIISAALCLLFVVLIFLAARSIPRTLITVAVGLLVAAAVLMLPWVFSDAILAMLRLKGAIYEFLQQTGLWQALAAELSKEYLVSPVTAAATGVVFLVGGISLRRFVPYSGKK
ncbi:MAG: hypothetical protein U1F40_01905 [Turneriella sp.]